mmetsp:Transcript_27287/g.63565  ORF Transcript_27287/g.63565 Transcript_27287/m.63565 type:complete len:205 (+) Transcript_27287:2009-2623(+)
MGLGPRQPASLTAAHGEDLAVVHLHLSPPPELAEARIHHSVLRELNGKVQGRGPLLAVDEWYLDVLQALAWAEDHLAGRLCVDPASLCRGIPRGIAHLRGAAVVPEAYDAQRHMRLLHAAEVQHCRELNHGPPLSGLEGQIAAPALPLQRTTPAQHGDWRLAWRLNANPQLRGFLGHQQLWLRGTVLLRPTRAHSTPEPSVKPA